MAKPRVFVSSTYYDLKYVRERLERFISSYCFEPVLFESDEVFFQPNSMLDESCYKEVENCHILILIVGGRYGSLASEQREAYENQFISITRKEYETARSKGIPIMVFVEQDVFAEYKTYMANKKKLPDNFKFAFVDDVRIFEFISILEQRAIKVFSKVDDIEHYISYQIAGMLLTYLKQLQEEKKRDEIKNAVDQLNVASSSMQKMLNLIGGKLLVDTQKEEYDNLILQQRKDLIDFFFTIFKQDFSIRKEDTVPNSSKTNLNAICKIIKDTIFNIKKTQEIHNSTQPVHKIVGYRKLERECELKIMNMNLGYSFSIANGEYRTALLQVMDIIKDDDALQKYFDKKLLATVERSIEQSTPKSRFYFTFKDNIEPDTDE